MSGGRTSQRSQSRNRKGAMEMTKWGTLTLDENPSMPPGVTGREDPISPKVPREILLRGNVSAIMQALLLVALVLLSSFCGRCVLRLKAAEWTKRSPSHPTSCLDFVAQASSTE